jgi:sugar transferase (PEP-CTERM system associated)
MVRVFNVYYPVRTLLLMGGEALLICTSFLLAALLSLGPQVLSVLGNEDGFYKILMITVMGLLCLYYFDLYDLERLRSPGEIYFRILVVLGILSLLLAGVALLVPEFTLGGNIFLVGLTILTGALLSWRSSFGWLMTLPVLRERVYILGAGDRATRLVESFRTRKELGMEVIGWAGEIGSGDQSRESLGEILLALKERNAVDRIVVAMEDRRGKMPVRELLTLRLNNVKIDDATALVEQISGKIEVDALHPSSLIFSDGFRLSAAFMLIRRVVSMLLAFLCLLLVLPVLPLIALSIKWTSPGSVFYKQRRVGRRGSVFYCLKFRTMRQDAEAANGATWATDNDPRITRVGGFLRRCRLDELPQLWNVLKGEMSFVGPRPERPEFVHSLSQEIPHYDLRHIVRPGLTGWAQINYPYGASVEDAKEKLKYDLYYIKNISVTFELFIVFQTIKIVLFGRGAK